MNGVLDFNEFKMIYCPDGTVTNNNQITKDMEIKVYWCELCVKLNMHYFQLVTFIFELLVK